MLNQDIELPKLAEEQVHRNEEKIVNRSPGTQDSVQIINQPAAGQGTPSSSTASVPGSPAAASGSSSKTFQKGMEKVGQNHDQIVDHK